jgi:type II secretory pathway predicted ATPase ExeA
MEHFGLVKEFRKAGYYETEHQQRLFKEIKAAITSGRLIAITGVIGCGKTVTLRRLQDFLGKEGKILVSKSLSVDKNRATLSTLISALFYDLSSEKVIKIPTQGEKRERELRDLIKKGRKPVALFVDEAHDLHSSTLTGIKRLIEVVEDSGGTLSVVLAGHPKLKNDLRRPTMEEIGYRATVFSLDGLIGSVREYIEWLLDNCKEPETKRTELIEDEAMELLASRLRTPLHLSALVEYRFSVKQTFLTVRTDRSVAQLVVINLS